MGMHIHQDSILTPPYLNKVYILQFCVQEVRLSGYCRDGVMKYLHKTRVVYRHCVSAFVMSSVIA